MKKSVNSHCTLNLILNCAAMTILLCSPILAVAQTVLTGNPPVPETNSVRGLKDYYKDYFPVGVSVSPASLTGEESDLIRKNFGSLSPENVMKSGLIHPQENNYAWENADQIVNFAQKNGLLCGVTRFAGTNKHRPGSLKIRREDPLPNRYCWAD